MDLVRRYILHNLALKLVALGLAVLLWLAVSRNPGTHPNPAPATAGNTR